MERISRLLLAAALCTVLFGCGGQKTKPIPEGVALVLKGSGATFPHLLYEKWFEEAYREVRPDVYVDYNAIGSGGGEREFRAGKTDFGASDAAFKGKLTDGQLGEAGIQLVPTTAGSIVLIHNFEGTGFEGDLRLSRQNYVDIFLGKIEEWNDQRIATSNPGVELPDLPVVPCVRLDSSGTTFAFTNHLSAISDEWKNGPGVGKIMDWPGASLPAPGNAGVAGLVKRTPGGIGYVEYGFSLKLDLKRASLENRAGQFVSPSGSSGSATIASAELSPSLRAFFPDPDGANSYPIVSLTWLILKKEYETAAKAKAVRELVDWCLTDGQEHAEPLGYLRLPASVAETARSALAAIGPR